MSGKTRNLQDVRQLAAALACAVTEESNRKNDCIAKNGVESLFYIIHKLMPEVSIFLSINFASHSNECGISQCTFSMTMKCRFVIFQNLEGIVIKAKYPKPNSTSCCNETMGSLPPAFESKAWKGNSKK